MAVETSIARRALIGTGLVAAGAVAGGAAGTLVAHEQVTQAYSDGYAAGKQAVINQLKQINGVQLQAALTTAHTTQAATKVIAKPASNMLNSIGGDALSSIVNVIGAVQTFVGFISGAYTLLGKLKDFFSGLQDTVTELPVAVDDLAGVDADAAASYLEGFVLIALEEA